jgi:hypothetical protein
LQARNRRTFRNSGPAAAFADQFFNVLARRCYIWRFEDVPAEGG